MTTGLDPSAWPVTPAAEIGRRFAEQRRHVIYFAGFGELGYERPVQVASLIEKILAAYSPDSTLVHGGTLLRTDGEDGIAMVYRVADSLGFPTTAIHPSIIYDFHDTHRISPFCRHPYIVDDDTWGGYLPDGRPSPTLALHLQVSDELVMIGGGMYAAEELHGFVAAGKTVRYLPARMNAAAARKWCTRVGIDVLDPAGAALAVWNELMPQL